MKRMRQILILGGIFCCCCFASWLFCGCGRKIQKEAVIPKAKLEFVSDPEGAQIFVNGTALGVTPKRFSVRPGNYLLRFVKEGCEPQFMPLEVKDGTPRTIKVRLESSRGSALLLSSPDRAQVIANGRTMGETPYVLSALPPGKHSIQIQKGGYAVRTVDFEVKDARPVKVSVKLQSNIGKLVIRSNPKNAQVLINGAPVGVTPYQGNWPEGNFDYKLRLGGFGEVSGKEIVKRGKTTVIERTLKILPASLRVESTPAGATVWIGSTNYGKTPLTISNLVPNKEYTVILQMKGCGSERKTVSVSPGRLGRVMAYLTSDRGGIDLFAGPAGLPVYCDGKKVGVLKSIEGKGENVLGKLEIRGLLPGPHKISIAHPRGIPPRIDRSVMVVKNKVEPVNIGRIWVPNAVIYYRDGQSAVGYIYGEDKEWGYWFEDAKYHGIKGRIPYDKVREVKRLPLIE